jgi:hypothetical protein
MAEMGDGVASWVQPVKPSLCCADPHDPGAIYVKRKDRVIAQAIRIVRIVLIGLQAVTVVPVQCTVTANPQEAVLILCDPTWYPILKRLVIYGEVREADILLIHHWKRHGAG